MPPPPHRKKPFSAKQKKEQLRAKKERRRHVENSASEPVTVVSEDEVEEEKRTAVDQTLVKLNQQPTINTSNPYDPNKYRLHFARETPEEIEKSKKKAQQALIPLNQDALEVDVNDVYQPGSVLDMPKRPAWRNNMTKQHLDNQEAAYFKRYLEDIYEKHSGSELSYMEFNLETWRQLWRVTEMSDVILLITDIRHPALHLSPTFYQHVTNELCKPLILILNKIDLAPAGLVAAWKSHLKQRFPNLHVICFASFSTPVMDGDPATVLHKRRRRNPTTSASSLQLLRVCENIVQGKVDLHSWEEKILSEGVESVSSSVEYEDEATSLQDHQQYKDGILTIGCCGYPNVGKSSVINGLVGKKVVSVSKTPGHTKHFQTIFLTPTVKLCDSPGLVFPSLISKPMQVLAGIYPIAQVRQPYTAVGYLAQRIHLTNILKLQHPDAAANDTKSHTWSAYDICEAWAEKRGYITAKAARPDVYRAANSILRLAVDGRLRLCFQPPGFLQRKDEWEQSKEARDISKLQTDSKVTANCMSASSSELSEQTTDEGEGDLGDTEVTATSNLFSVLCDDDE